MPYTGSRPSCKTTRMHKESVTDNALLVSYYAIELLDVPDIFFFSDFSTIFQICEWNAHSVSLYFSGIDQMKYRQFVYLKNCNWPEGLKFTCVVSLYPCIWASACACECVRLNVCVCCWSICRPDIRYCWSCKDGLEGADSRGAKGVLDRVGVPRVGLAQIHARTKHTRKTHVHNTASGQ